MRTLQKTVYYCDYCRKHGLSRHAMEMHERVCTVNPKRVCRWKIDGHDPEPNLPYLYGAIQERAPLDVSDIEWLRREVAGCPACMLAVLRQSGVEFHYSPRGAAIFSYDDEVERLRVEERTAMAGDMR